MSKLGLRALGAAAGLTVALISGAQAEDKVVNVFNWSDYIDQSVLDDFTKETGIKVVYDVFDSNDILETKLLAGGTGYDVVVPSAEFLARQIQAGVFQKLDKSKLPNLVNVWPDVAERLAVYDPGNEYAVNYMWGTTGIGYNPDKIKAIDPNAPVDSWKILFDPETVAKFKSCGIYVLDAPEELIPAALNYLGKDPNSKDSADIEAAGELLKSIAPNIQKFNSSEYINALANGDICLAVGYSGDVLQARNRAAEAKNGVTVAYSVPKEGAKLFFDNMAIPADAPHPEEALAFINFILKPEEIAKSSNYVSYANGNLASQKFIDPAILNDKAIFPDAETMKHLYGISPYDPKSQRVLTRVWTSVKTGM
ncbi:polyamine ABC transporter substrate-binding protein [Oryzibacter oryziterrae]|uniref:polyamine ABC transporter substrate-binding protein n=1 Tax=Oryzibacter oryziterrae TaxID=2766474 RepID=UPI001F4098CE|nr:polyamine ABC transporter substrate-binding protein [Oryzibacter oryziterrae]